MALISHQYKFIFIKTVKTAGTATEVTLSSLMAPEDIITPILPLEAGHRARNYETPRGNYYNHMPATEIRDLLGPEIFGSYFKFCVEKAPVDKCLSHYAMMKHSSYHNKDYADLTWSEYVRRQMFPIDVKKYTDEAGRVIVDRILDYANLNSALSETLLKLGVPFEGLTSNAKSGFRKKVPNLDEVSDMERRVISRAFRETTAIVKAWNL